MASLDTIDNGKTYADAVNDIKYSMDVFRYYAGWCDKIHGQTIPAGTFNNIMLKIILSFVDMLDTNYDFMIYVTY